MSFDRSVFGSSKVVDIGHSLFLTDKQISYGGPLIEALTSLDFVQIGRYVAELEEHECQGWPYVTRLNTGRVHGVLFSSGDQKKWEEFLKIAGLYCNFGQFVRIDDCWVRREEGVGATFKADTIMHMSGHRKQM